MAATVVAGSFQMICQKHQFPLIGRIPVPDASQKRCCFRPRLLLQYNNLVTPYTFAGGFAALHHEIAGVVF